MTRTRITYTEVVEWAKSPNGRISIGADLGPISVGQLVQLIHDQYKVVIAACEYLNVEQEWQGRKHTKELRARMDAARAELQAQIAKAEGRGSTTTDS